MKRIFLVLLWPLWMGPLSVVTGDDQAASVPAPASSVLALRHTTHLKFKDGSYTSIFGLIPKKYNLDSEDARVIVQRVESASVFTLELVSSEARRILSIPDENPTVESASKPLTGKTIRVTNHDGKWMPEVLGVTDAAPEEKSEADRLAARFQPGASPFARIEWTAEGTAVLDLPEFLRFLGYPQALDLHGSVELRRTSETPDNEPKLLLKTEFTSGEDVNRIVIDIEAEGGVTLSNDFPHYRDVRLSGQLNIHGLRILPDGRKVPYSLLTPFSYETVVTPATDS